MDLLRVQDQLYILELAGFEHDDGVICMVLYELSCKKIVTLSKKKPQNRCRHMKACLKLICRRACITIIMLCVSSPHQHYFYDPS